jgi:hypothetical protein
MGAKRITARSVLDRDLPESSAAAEEIGDQVLQVARIDRVADRG